MNTLLASALMSARISYCIAIGSVTRQETRDLICLSVRASLQPVSAGGSWTEVDLGTDRQLQAIHMLACPLRKAVQFTPIGVMSAHVAAAPYVLRLTTSMQGPCNSSFRLNSGETWISTFAECLRRSCHLILDRRYPSPDKRSCAA